MFYCTLKMHIDITMFFFFLIDIDVSQVKPFSQSIYFRLSISLQPSPIRINPFHLVLAIHLNLVPLMAMEAYGLHLHSQIQVMLAQPSASNR